MSKLTLIGMYNYYNQLGKDLFSTLSFPDGVDKPTVIDRILIRGGEFETVYSDPDFLNYSFTSFSKSWYRTFEKWVQALAIDYNPLENYDRIEDISISENGKNIKSGSESDDNSLHRDISNSSNYNDESTTKGSSTGSENSNTLYNGTSTVNNEKTGTEGDSGSKIRTGSESDSGSNTKTGSELTENTVSAFNASGYSPHDKSDVTYNSVTDTTGNTHTYSNVTDTNNNTHTYNTKDDTTTLDNNSTGVTKTLSDDTTSNNVGSGRTSDTSKELTSNKGTHSYNDVTDNMNKSTTHHARLHGNIGVTTSQQMLESELEIAKWNLTESIVDIFLKEYVLPIY